MSYYFNLEELRREMSDARLFSRRFETMLTFKLNSLKELCGRLPRENEAFFIETKKSFTAFTFIVYLIKNGAFKNNVFYNIHLSSDFLLCTSIFYEADSCTRKESLRVLSEQKNSSRTYPLA